MRFLEDLTFGPGPTYDDAKSSASDDLPVLSEAFAFSIFRQRLATTLDGSNM